MRPDGHIGFHGGDLRAQLAQELLRVTELGWQRASMGQHQRANDGADRLYIYDNAPPRRLTA